MSINGLNKITDRIIAEAKEEAARIIADAETECNRISAEYTARADAIREKLSAEAEREGTDLIARARSASATKKRNIMMQTQSQLLDSVFDDTFAQMRNLEEEQYTVLLIGLLCRALTEQIETEKISRTLYGEEDALAPSQYEVIMNPKDRERCGVALIDGVKKALSGKLPVQTLEKLILSDKTAAIDGGLILRCGNIESNCSFKLLFAQLREELESEVSHALFDFDNRNGRKG